MKDIIIILLCIPLYVTNSFCDKYVSARGKGSGELYNAVKFFIGSICFLPLVLFDGAPRFKAGVLLCGIACGMMYAVSKTIILRGYSKTSVAFMTLCHSAGMIVPCVIGHFFWGERLSLLALGGIVLTVLSAVLLKGGNEEKKGFTALGILIGAAVFLTSGGVMVCQKLMGMYFPEQSVVAYNFYSFVVPFLVIGAFLPKGKNRTAKDVKTVLPFAAGSAISLCVISFVMTSLAGRVPSVVMFPLFNGLGIVLVCAVSAIVFKERLNAKRMVGIILGLGGLFLISVFG
ncbi:MAG: DMT family transporter [Clostridia bacterium]|nr:DMT family transporter [Clostridia bacterium]